MSNRSTLKITPLGGLGHIGGNMMVYETDDDAIMVDCGVLFPQPEQPGVDYVIPDVSYLKAQKKKLRAIVLTHGHEDHIGAVPYVLRELDAPVYATRFTLALLSQKMTEHPTISPAFHLIQDNVPFEFGSLRLQPIPITHSIPDAVMLAMQTPIGWVVHTGDFKLEANPLDQRHNNLAALADIAKQGITVLLSDSTNAEREGHTWDECILEQSLNKLITEAPRGVVVTAFASNLFRMQMVLQASEAAGRRVFPIGRSMYQNLHIALEQGFLRARFGIIGEPDELLHYPAQKTTILAGGSQGEGRSALARIARGEHSSIHIEPGDRVIFSSRRIPGNERAISGLINDLARMGAEIIDDRVTKVHASGHAFQEEQREIINICKPEYFIPIHGEYRHLACHSQMAIAAGIKPDRALVIEDGQPLLFTQHKQGVFRSIAEPVTTGFVYVDGKGMGEVDDDVLRQRRKLAHSGVVACSIQQNSKATWTAELNVCGVLREGLSSDLLTKAKKDVLEHLNGPMSYLEPATRQEELRTVIRSFFRRALGRTPMVMIISTKNDI